jgi:DNA-binding MarR family transcriptional regulator
MLKRQTSIYREKWDAHKGTIDALDRRIIRCLYDKPGINITRVWTCINNGDGIKKLGVYYRINTLEKAGLVETKRGTRNERRCFLTQPAREAWRSGRYGSGNNEREKKALDSKT